MYSGAGCRVSSVGCRVWGKGLGFMLTCSASSRSRLSAGGPMKNLALGVRVYVLGFRV